MVTQKPISLEIDCELLEELDKEVSLGWRKRNWHINQAIRLYLSLQARRRHARKTGNFDAKVNEVYAWLKKNIPEAVLW